MEKEDATTVIGEGQAANILAINVRMTSNFKELKSKKRWKRFYKKNNNNKEKKKKNTF